MHFTDIIQKKSYYYFMLKNTILKLATIHFFNIYRHLNL